MKDKKKLLIGILSLLICIMAVGYALLAQELTINGTASIDSTWKVEITNITSKDVVGDAVNKTDPSYTATNANFSVGFTQPGDSITYDITLTNKGTLDAVVESITVNKGDNPAIVYTTSGLKRGDKIAKNNGTNILTVKVDYDSSVTTQPASTTNDITVTINYQQDLGQVVVYEAYSIGDTVEFAGSNWRLIKNSTTEEDYVTLMKETVLTNAELGDYAFNSSYNAMEFTWTDSCHNSNHGYANNIWNCDNANIYSESKIKEMLETRYLPIVGADHLKEIDGYMIRLITVEELISNLGCTSISCTSSTYASWVYQNFGNQSKSAYGYWTMTPHPDSSSSALHISSMGEIDQNNVNDNYYDYYGVRPVINLLKSSIE